jgi:hypothetical protein
MTVYCRSDVLRNRMLAAEKGHKYRGDQRGREDTAHEGDKTILQNAPVLSFPRESPFRTSRKTEGGAKRFLTHLAVRAVPFAILFEAKLPR